MLKESIYKNHENQVIGKIQMNQSKRFVCLVGDDKKSFPTYRESEAFVLEHSGGEYSSMEFTVSNK